MDFNTSTGGGVRSRNETEVCSRMDLGMGPQLVPKHTCSVT